MTLPGYHQDMSPQRPITSNELEAFRAGVKVGLVLMSCAWACAIVTCLDAVLQPYAGLGLMGSLAGIVWALNKEPERITPPPLPVPLKRRHRPQGK